jgi:formylglycine-generating enzyme required for sulfatase activity
MPSRVHFAAPWSQLAEGQRTLPFAIAATVCTIIAITLGYTAWFFWGDRDRIVSSERAELAQPVSTGKPAESAPEPKVVLAPAGELAVPRGTVTLDGEGDRPARKIALESFSISETEVTNDQYFQFIKETGYKPPQTWTGGKYKAGTANEPVTYVSWRDAVAYCDWLTGKIGASVRLPTEAQWELAAKGPNGRKYPWGDEWDGSAAVSVETKGQVRPVKSFPVNQSPCGAYDMAGNVWEWVANPGHDADGFPVSSDGVEYRLAKGGSANEPMEFITTSSRVKLRADRKDKYLGFRYIVLRGNEAKPQTDASTDAASPGIAKRAQSPEDPSAKSR